MSLSSFNSGMDVAYHGNEPDAERIQNDQDYLVGFCYGESFNRYYNEKRIREYEEQDLDYEII